MSLGWQTESALLPSKSKPIHVDDKSILKLKSFITDQEQRKKLHSLSDQGRNFPIRRLNKPNQKLQEKSTEPEKSKPDADNTASSSSEMYRVQKALEAKSKLYEEMLHGGQREGLDLHDSEYPVLVDFAQKRNNATKRSQFEDEESITEETRESNSNQPEAITEPAVSNQWQWSTSSATTTTTEKDQYLNEKKRERDFKELVEQKIAAEMHPQQSHTGKISEAARIKTQWEKTLQSTSKIYLEEVHQQTLSQRQKESSRETSQTEASVLQKRSAREVKLEMIKRKKLEKQQLEG